MDQETEKRLKNLCDIVRKFKTIVETSYEIYGATKSVVILFHKNFFIFKEYPQRILSFQPDAIYTGLRSGLIKTSQETFPVWTLPSIKQHNPLFIKLIQHVFDFKTNLNFCVKTQIGENVIISIDNIQEASARISIKKQN